MLALEPGMVMACHPRDQPAELLSWRVASTGFTVLILLSRSLFHSLSVLV